MELLPAIDGEPPTPGPIRALDRWRVAWHGRRDATRPASVDRPRPYLESLRAQAEAGQGAVSGWLHGKITPIDREAAHLLIVLDQYRRDPAIPPEPTPPRSAPDDADPRPVSTIPPWVREAREVAALHNAFKRRIRERDEAERRLGELGATRHHLIEVARTAANAHVARYGRLVWLYETARLGRRRNQNQAKFDGQPPTVSTAGGQPPAASTVGGQPAAISTEPWIRGDMPLLALEVDSQVADSCRWVLKEFGTRTAELERRIPGKVPHPN